MYVEMWKKMGVMLLISVAIIAGCSNEHQGHDNMDMNMGMSTSDLIKVELHVPRDIQVNQQVTFTAHVSQDDKDVVDADKVEFEWWIEGGEHHKAEVKHSADGDYVLEQTFEEPGTYTIISHVTVKSMHSMPKKTFEVKS